MITKTRVQSRNSLAYPGRDPRPKLPAESLGLLRRRMGTRIPAPRRMNWRQFTYRLALTLMANPKPRNVKSRDEPP